MHDKPINYQLDNEKYTLLADNEITVNHLNRQYKAKLLLVTLQVEPLHSMWRYAPLKLVCQPPMNTEEEQHNKNAVVVFMK